MNSNPLAINLSRIFAWWCYSLHLCLRPHRPTNEDELRPEPAQPGHIPGKDQDHCDRGGMPNPNLPDRFLILFCVRRLLELPHLEKTFPVFGLCIRAFFSVVPFLVALETLNILQVHCLCGIRYFCVFPERRPRRSLWYRSLVSWIWSHLRSYLSLLSWVLDAWFFRYLHNISIISQLMSCFGHHIHQCLEYAGIDHLAKYLRLETTNIFTISFSGSRWAFPAANTQNLKSSTYCT